METWIGNGNHARHAKEQCYVMLGRCVSIKNKTEYVRFLGGSLTLKGSSPRKKTQEKGQVELCICPSRGTTPKGVRLEKAKTGAMSDSGKTALEGNYRTTLGT